MDEKIREKIALFRFSMIAAVLHSEGKGQMEYFRQMAQKTHDAPHYGLREYQAETFKSWLKDYRRGGFDSLKPRIRSDKGKTRVITPELGNIIKDRRELYPILSCSAFYKLLISEGFIDASVVPEPTLRNFLKSENLFKIKEDVKARKKFEREHINELWIGDFMHGPYFPIDKRKRQVFLCAIIDDFSRMCVGAEFFSHENTMALERTFKNALLQYGLPSRFYCDNGSIYRSHHLQLVCARLKIALIHSKPYDSPSRGKVERFFRSVRQRFLPLLHPHEISSLDDLNTRFFRWLDQEYHHCHHHGINTRPIDRWMADLKETPIQRLSEHELDQFFLQTIKRKVKNDSTVSIFGTLYEVPPKYIGELIELRFPTDKPHNISIYENNQPVCCIKKLNPHENAKNPLSGIKFSREENDGGDKP